MPLYMDRHDGGDLTPEAVVEAHAADLKIQEKYDCKFITYWFAEERDSTFCLVSAPDMSTVHKVHNKAHENLHEKMRLRIGISAGEPVHNDNQLYGAAVNLAARLCAHAKPGTILVAQVVRDLLIGKNFPFTGMGEFEAKGFDQPIPLIEVAWRDASSAPS